MKCLEYFMETWSVKKGWSNSPNLTSENYDVFYYVVVKVLIINTMLVLNWCLNRTITTQIEMKISKIKETEINNTNINFF